MTTIAQPAPHLPTAPRTRPRVLFLLEEYPQVGQTQIASEIEALEQDYEIGIFALRRAALPYARHRPHRIIPTLAEIIADIGVFAPDVLHTHGLGMLGLVGEVSRISGIPFTLRTHSADTLALRPRGLGDRVRQILREEVPLERSPTFIEGLKTIDSELCLGILCFPFARTWLKRAGVREAKLVDSFPVVHYSRFHDRSPNGDAVMTIGSPARGRALQEFLRLARKVPDRRFHCYALDGSTAAIAAEIAGIGSAIGFPAPVEHDAMPREYKQHRWLVLTADPANNTWGWPMVIAEAQAAGVGVCMPALRPDLAHYVGEGAGILYDTIDELPAIVSGPVPEEMRMRGFEQARKSDIARHKHLLTDLWDDSLRSRGPSTRTFSGTVSSAPAGFVQKTAAGLATPA